MFTLSAASQEKIEGNWLTTIDPPGIPVVLHFEKGKGAAIEWVASLDSPQQNAFALPLQVSISGSELNAKFAPGSIDLTLHYDADSDTLSGIWSQSGKTVPVTFARTNKIVTRPQEPHPPFPYDGQEVTFKNKNGDSISGTLTVPKGAGPFAAAVLICGSGPNTRDEPIFRHKPFLLIADWLTRHGFAVLRYDKRGTGTSGGDRDSATISDYTDDAVWAVDFLHSRSEIDAHKIGLIGHSEGGLVAPLVVQERKDIAYVVLLAGPVVDGYRILQYQYANLGQEQQKHTEIMDIARAAKTHSELKEQALKLLKDNGESSAVVDAAAKQFSSPWYFDFVHYDPAPTLAQVACPVLALYGEKDMQVPVSLNMPVIKEIIEAQKPSHIELEVIPNANHLFQKCKTGSPSEYFEIEETMQPVVLEKISDWMNAVVKK